MTAEFELTDEEYARLYEASKPVPWFAPGGVWPETPRAKAERVWYAIGAARGFDWSTARPAPGKSDRFFVAELTHKEAAMEGEHEGATEQEQPTEEHKASDQGDGGGNETDEPKEPAAE